MADSDQEKIHPPTPRRRKQARDEGRVARSGEFVSSLVLLAATAGIWIWGQSTAQELTRLMQNGFADSSTTTLSANDASLLLSGLAFVAARLTLPILALLFILGIAGNVLQTGPLFTPTKALPSLDRLNVAAGIRRMVSARRVASLGFSVLKLGVLCLVVTWLVRTRGPRVLQLGALETSSMASELFDIVHAGCFWIASSLVLLSGLDYAIAWWHHEQDLKMTEQELREELRDNETNRQSVRHASTQPVSPA